MLTLSYQSDLPTIHVHSYLALQFMYYKVRAVANSSRPGEGGVGPTTMHPSDLGPAGSLL